MSVASQRRRMAFARFSTGFRHDRAGMAGLGILAVFIATAILAPILIPESALDLTNEILCVFLFDFSKTFLLVLVA